MCSNWCATNIAQLISQRGNSYLCYCNCDKYELHMKIASFAGQETKYRYSIVMKKGFRKLCSGKWTICIYKNQKPEWLGWKILNKPGTLEASCSTFFNNSREIQVLQCENKFTFAMWYLSMNGKILRFGGSTRTCHFLQHCGHNLQLPFWFIHVFQNQP